MTDSEAEKKVSLLSIRRSVWVVIVLLAGLVALELAPLLMGTMSRAKKSEAAVSPTTAPSLQQTKASGGSIKTSLGYGFALNKNSGLEREWITLHTPSLPVDINGTTGVRTVYKEQYEYALECEITAKEAISAIEVMVLTFDVWGEHVRNLSLTEIRDIAPGTSKLTAAWSLYSENEATEFYASIAYVAKVRTKDGRVLTTDSGPVVEAARTFSAKFTAQDLEPPKPEKK